MHASVLGVCAEWRGCSGCCCLFHSTGACCTWPLLYKLDTTGSPKRVTVWRCIRYCDHHVFKPPKLGNLCYVNELYVLAFTSRLIGWCGHRKRWQCHILAHNQRQEASELPLQDDTYTTPSKMGMAVKPSSHLVEHLLCYANAIYLSVSL